VHPLGRIVPPHEAERVAGRVGVHPELLAPARQPLRAKGQHPPGRSAILPEPPTLTSIMN